MTESSEIDIEGAVCPVPLVHKDQIVIGHGSGGKLSHELVAGLFLPAFDNPILRAGDDAGLAQPNACTRLAISIDSHVVWPIIFPGGDIGRLAVCGTVNDVSMLGAEPLYLSASFILEEGLSINLLQQIIISMREAANEAGVQIVAGDTKVVQKGKADGLYINTCGIGLVIPGAEIGGAQARPGDKVIVSGPIGDHGIAVLAARGELGFDAEVKSDVAPLNKLVASILEASDQVHVLRDPTRGGLATSLNEIAHQSKVGMMIDESTIPVRPAVRAACELLGFDPLYIANEGKLIAIIGQDDAEKVLLAMRKNAYGQQAVIIGEVIEAPQERVLMKTTIGSTRIVDTLSGELLPRIC